MESTEEIVPGFKLPEHEIMRYGAHQPEYRPLPMWADNTLEGRRVSRWTLSWKERFQILFGGSIWITVLTFGRPLQPLLPQAHCPLQASAMLDEEM